MYFQLISADRKTTPIPIRYVVSFLGFLSFMFNYMLRVNINFTIVSMVNFDKNSSSENSDECGFFGQENNTDSTTENEVRFKKI